jgi:hypothetical protein
MPTENYGMTFNYITKPNTWCKIKKHLKKAAVAPTRSSQMFSRRLLTMETQFYCRALNVKLVVIWGRGLSGQFDAPNR